MNNKNFSIDTVKDFFKKNGRYVAAAVLFVVLIIVVVALVGRGQDDGQKNADFTGIEAETETETEELYSVNLYPEINELVTNYYNFYANGDTDSMSAFVTPLSDNEKSFIQMYSQYVESYQNISCYTKSGLDDKSYLVSVYLDIKFTGVDTLAPGLAFFYVQTNEDGSLYINNLYSQYNQLSSEYPLDTNVESFIDEFETQDDVVALQVDVQSKFEEAVNADTNLYAMVNTTIRDSYAAWSAALNEQQAAAEQAAADQAAADQAAADQAAADQAAADQAAADQAAAEQAAQTATTETVYTTDRVNIRASADENGERLGSADAGTALTKTGDAGNGWTSIDYNGTTAYVKSDYLTTDANAVSQTTASVASGTEVMLSQTCNIRASMSETADRVGVAYAGETITVEESYAEGWSKVTWNGKTGYIKTDLLQ